jgi:hypothetical protein
MVGKLNNEVNRDPAMASGTTSHSIDTSIYILVLYGAGILHLKIIFDGPAGWL